MSLSRAGGKSVCLTLFLGYAVWKGKVEKKWSGSGRERTEEWYEESLETWLAARSKHKYKHSECLIPWGLCFSGQFICGEEGERIYSPPGLLGPEDCTIGYIDSPLPDGWAFLVLGCKGNFWAGGQWLLSGEEVTRC